ncbi:MAG: MFS transporter [Arachnia sp.]
MSVEQREVAGVAAAAPASLKEAWVALAGLSAVFLFEMLDNSILNVALPTIGRDLEASTAALQWVTSAYAVVFGGLMLIFGAVADRFGRRRVMLVGLALLGAASLATAAVSTMGELVAVRAAMGAAAAMTTPGAMALAFRLFRDNALRVRAITLISTVGLVGLAVGPTVGGLVLAFAPWQALLLVNAPVAALAMVCIRWGVPADDPAELHPERIDVAGGVLGTVAIVSALLAPTLFLEEGAHAWLPWGVAALALAGGWAFVLRERSTAHPLLDLRAVALPLVSSGLAFKAAAGLATAGLGYLVTLQLQLQWGWPPAVASLGMLPQVVVLLAGSAFVEPLVRRVGLQRAAWLSSLAVVAGLAVYALGNRFGYLWVGLALALVAAGLRVVGVVAATNVLDGLPPNRTTVGAALTDTATEVAHGVGIAVAGTILAAMVTGSVATSDWDPRRSAEFQAAVTAAGVALTLATAGLVGWGRLRARAPRV